MKKQRTVPDEPHSLGRYQCAFVKLDKAAMSFEFTHKRDANGNNILFFDGKSYWMVPLTAGVPAVKVKR